MIDIRRNFWAILLAAGIASTAFGVIIFAPFIGNAIREPDTLFQLPLEDVPVIILWLS